MRWGRWLGVGAKALFGGGFWHTRCGVVCGGSRERCFGGLPWLSPAAYGGQAPSASSYPQAGTSPHPRTGVYPSPSPTTHTRKPAARAAAVSATARASNNQAGCRITAAGGHAQISSDLVFAHLGIHDRQHGTFLQQITADADGRC